MNFDYAGKTYIVKDITRAERRKIAALYPGAFKTDGEKAVVDGHGMNVLCEATLVLSGLSDDELDGLTALEQNTLLITLANEYATGLAGKGSGA